MKLPSPAWKNDFFLPLAVRVIRILISKVECRTENDAKEKKEQTKDPQLEEKQKDHGRYLTTCLSQPGILCARSP